MIMGVDKDVPKEIPRTRISTTPITAPSSSIDTSVDDNDLLNLDPDPKSDLPYSPPPSSSAPTPSLLAPMVAKAPSVSPLSPSAAPPPKKKSIFSIRKNKDQRETDINKLLTSNEESTAVFSSALAGYLTYGAPGRFPSLESTLSVAGPFDLEASRSELSSMAASLPNPSESFACVVNCMIINIVDLASSTLKEKDSKMIVKGLDVVLDFMEFAAGLYESVAGDAVIKPVVYQGSLGRGQLEKMYGKYISANMMSMDEKVSRKARI